MDDLALGQVSSTVLPTQISRNENSLDFKCDTILNIENIY